MRLSTFLLLSIILLSNGCGFGTTGDREQEKAAMAWLLVQQQLKRSGSLEYSILFTDGEYDPDLTSFAVADALYSYTITLDSSTGFDLEKIELWMREGDDYFNEIHYEPMMVARHGGATTIPVTSDPESIYATPFILSEATQFSGNLNSPQSLDGSLYGRKDFARSEDLPRGRIAAVVEHYNDIAFFGAVLRSDGSRRLIAVHTGKYDYTYVPVCHGYLAAGDLQRIAIVMHYREFFQSIGSPGLIESIFSGSAEGSTVVIDPYATPELFAMLKANLDRSGVRSEYGCTGSLF